MTANKSPIFSGSGSFGHEDDDAEQDEFRATRKFLHSHGINLDYIFAGDISGLICAGAINSARAAAIKAAT